MPTKFNPADCMSCGATVEALLEGHLWFHGLEFLKCTPDYWHSRFEETGMLSEDIKVFDKPIVNVFMVDGVSANEYLISYFSSLHQLKKATAWLLKFEECLK